MKTVALLGIGLMGGSIGRALKARNIPLCIQAYARREETRNQALQDGVADAVFTDPAGAVHDADLVIVCVPVCAIPSLVKAAKPGLKAGAVVTDVGSTKKWLDEQCRAILADTDACFVGSHPMCGSEKTGIEVADPELYENAVCVVCADAETRSEVWKVSQFWTRIGAKVLEMPAEKHDRIAAVTSHVPHLAASALVRGCTQPPADLLPLIGSGFKDTTRVASGDPAIWRDIVKTNTPAILDALEELQGQLAELVDEIKTGDAESVEAFLADGVRIRNQLCQASRSFANANDVIAIDGPSASGKSTVAKSIARNLGALYVDSGAMYRGMTWKVLQAGADPEDEQAVTALLDTVDWEFQVNDGAVAFTIDGINPGEAIRGEAVRENVSYVARIPEVRRFIVNQIRRMRELGSLVVEGRDIGSVVFPDSPHKFYLDADPVERARRRNAELLATESDTSVEAVQESLAKRDHLDSTRKTDPLQVAEGAQVVDTTHLTLEQVVEEILDMLGGSED